MIFHVSYSWCLVANGKTELHSSYEQRESATSYSTRKLRRIPRCLLSLLLTHTCHPPVLCLSSYFLPTKKQKPTTKINIQKEGKTKKIFGKIGDRRRREGNRHGSGDHFPLGRTCNHYPTSSYTSLGLVATGSDSSLVPDPHPLSDF